LRKQANSWVVTSQWSVRWLAENHHRLGLGAMDKFFCLSSQQEEILARITRQNHTAETPNVDSLIKKIKEEHQEGDIIYLRGNRSLKHIKKDLKKVKEVVVYDNQPIRVHIKNPFDAYIFFSPSGIQSFIEAGNTIPPSASIYTIGHTTGGEARSCFPNAIYESSAQDELAFLQHVVKQLKENKQ
jgi:uroporphyrinogen-III synthase